MSRASCLIGAGGPARAARPRASAERRRTARARVAQGAGAATQPASACAGRADHARQIVLESQRRLSISQLMSVAKCGIAGDGDRRHAGGDRASSTPDWTCRREAQVGRQRARRRDHSSSPAGVTRKANGRQRRQQRRPAVEVERACRPAMRLAGARRHRLGRDDVVDEQRQPLHHRRWRQGFMASSMRDCRQRAPAPEGDACRRMVYFAPPPP